MSKVIVALPTLSLMLACTLIAGGITTGNIAFAETDFEEIWFSTIQCDSPAHMEVSVVYPETAVPEETISFQVNLAAGIPYQSVQVDVIIEDSEATVIHRAALEANLHAGRNQITFQWCGSDISSGNYIMKVEVDYSDSFPTIICSLPFCKVSSSQWKQDIEHTGELLDALKKTFQDSPSASPGNQLYTQFLVTRGTLKAACTALDMQDWRKLDRLVVYLKNSCNALHAGVVFGSSFSEMDFAVTPPSLEKIEIREGGIYASDQPVFLFGKELDSDSSITAQLERLHQYGLNFAVKTVGVNESPDAAADILQGTIEAAKDQSIALAVQFDQNIIAGDIMDQWPELLEPGFVNMAHEDFRTLYTERLVALAEALTGKTMVVCASIADTPRFKYGGEFVRRQFIQHIQQRYPDRIDLNRLWRSHLAEYDEITICGDDPEHSYQNRRAFQYEWQSFQREMITRFLAGIDQELSRVAQDLPIALTLSNSAFQAAETRTGINRENAASMMDINSCTTISGTREALYAINYPSSHVYHTLMRSYTPNKPILNLRGDIKLSDVDSPEMRYALVQSTLWESVMTGGNGMALAADSAVLEYPEALEAFVTAAHDINRLASVITAFQQEPAQIGILFSEASKIMDDGIPHLKSAKFAFEGASFSGYTLRFITESQIMNGALVSLNILILPETLSVSDATFEHLSKYVDDGGTVARVGKPIPYNERGLSRIDVIRSTANTVLVRGMNLPTEYLHAMDAAQESGALPEIARPINEFGYPIEGVRSSYVSYKDENYLYIINLRKDSVNCYLAGISDSGLDLIQRRNVDFPRLLFPLEPMLIRMDKHNLEIISTQH
ncbi:MAG: beta-galactosidase [Candidatus Hydrogenedentes bacterium]|nr:beta-galactosidase [Candidatus Hydrogenedentota bacterium]